MFEAFCSLTWVLLVFVWFTLFNYMTSVVFVWFVIFVLLFAALTEVPSLPILSSCFFSITLVIVWLSVGLASVFGTELFLLVTLDFELDLFYVLDGYLVLCNSESKIIVGLESAKMTSLAGISILVYSSSIYATFTLFEFELTVFLVLEAVLLSFNSESKIMVGLESAKMTSLAGISILVYSSSIDVTLPIFYDMTVNYIKIPNKANRRTILFTTLIY